MFYTFPSIGEMKLPFCYLYLSVLSNDQTVIEPEMQSFPVKGRGMQAVQRDSRESEGGCFSLELVCKSWLSHLLAVTGKSPVAWTLGSLCQISRVGLVFQAPFTFCLFEFLCLRRVLWTESHISFTSLLFSEMG
jgi:hypothetical protein